MDARRSFNDDLGQLRWLGYDDLADAAAGLAAFARAKSGSREQLNEREGRWEFRVDRVKGAFIALKVQPRARDVELCLRGWPSDFSTPELPAKPKMGLG